MDWASILGYTINDIEAREEVTDSIYAFMTRVSGYCSQCLIWCSIIRIFIRMCTTYKYTYCLLQNDVNENSEIRSNPAKLLKLIQIAQVVLKVI